MRITVEVQDVSKKLFLTQEGGKGSWGKTEFEFYTTIPDGSPILDLGQGQKKYKVSVADIIKAIFEQIIDVDDSALAREVVAQVEEKNGG